MSINRTRSRAVNNHVLFHNRLTNFTSPPIHNGDLYVERNELIGGNLDVSGNLTVRKDIRAKNFYASGNFYLDNYVLIPAGTVIQSAAISEPDGWFECDGRSLDTTVYTDLFGAIGYTYGGSNGFFKIPDTRGRVCIGAGQGNGLTNHNLSSTGGEEAHTLSVNEIPSHSHSLIRRANSDTGTYDTDNLRQDESSACTTDRAELGPFNTFNTGGSAAHNIMQPFIALRHLIKY